jgi:hypothetical protein
MDPTKVDAGKCDDGGLALGGRSAGTAGVRTREWLDFCRVVTTSPPPVSGCRPMRSWGMNGRLPTTA